MTSQKQLGHAVAKKIRTQFPDTAEGKLWYSVIEGAINDLFHPLRRQAGIAYLTSDILAAQVCNVDCDWIHRLLKEAGLLTDADFIAPAPVPVKKKPKRAQRNRSFHYEARA